MTDTVNTDISASAPDDVNLDDFSADFFSDDKAPVKVNPEESESEEPTSQDDEADFEDEGDETDEADEGHEPDESDEGNEAPVKKKSRYQKRIDEFNAKVKEAERREAETYARLEAALAKLNESADKPVEKPTQNTPKTEVGLVEPTPDDILEDGSPKYPLGEFDPKLLRDLTRFDRAVERAREEEVAKTVKAEREQIEQLNTLQTEWNGKVEAAKETYPDYVEKGQVLLDSLGHVEPEYALYLTQNLMSMDYGPDVFYYLAEHPEEARAIVNSSPERALNRLGRIEARFEIAAQERSGKETKMRTTNAPTPAPRNRGSNAQAPRIDLADANLDDFEREFFRKK